MKADETAAGADEMARHLDQLAGVANEAGMLSDQVSGSAGALLRDAIGLKTAMDIFVQGLRAA